MSKATRPARPKPTPPGDLQVNPILKRARTQGRASTPKIATDGTDPSPGPGGPEAPVATVDPAPASAVPEQAPAPDRALGVAVEQPPAAPVATPAGTLTPEPADVPATDATPREPHVGTDAGTATPAPDQPASVPERPLAGPPLPGEEYTRRTVTLSPVLIAAAEDWQRARRDTFRRPALSWLLDAAFADLPTDLPSLRALAEELPESLRAVRPHQVGGTLRRQTVRRIEDAYFELSMTRRRDPALWHALSTALLRQLRAEGVEVTLPSSRP